MAADTGWADNLVEVALLPCLDTDLAPAGHKTEKKHKYVTTLHHYYTTLSNPGCVAAVMGHSAQAALANTLFHMKVRRSELLGLPWV
jgi:hypothetical protein